MGKINNLKIYQERMYLGMEDKLFFLDHIDLDDVETVIDFGCADGVMLSMLPPTWKKIGVDNSEEMLEKAKENCPEAMYFSSLEEANKEKKGRTLIIFSSVLHEIYSYLPKSDAHNLWNIVKYSDYNYIVIRDMAYSLSGISEAKRAEIDPIRNSDKGYLFENYHAIFLKKKPKISKNDLVHFLMKYRYTENWDRECIENYFALSSNDVLQLKPYNHELVYFESYTLPYIKETVKKDFGYEITLPTHVKYISKKVDV